MGVEFDLNADHPKALEAARLIRSLVTARREAEDDDTGVWRDLLQEFTNQSLEDPELLAYILAVASTFIMGFNDALASARGTDVDATLTELFVLFESEGITF